MRKMVKMSLAAAMMMGIGSVSAQAEGLDVLSNIKANGEIRARYEMVDAEDAANNGNANAFTNRLRLGVSADLFGTSWLSGYAEMTDVRALNGNYNDGYAGNGAEKHDTVADSEQTRLTQAYIDAKYGQTKLRVGRQMINLDNQRFVGASAWRQMFTTFDAVTLTDSTIKNLDLFASYVTQVNHVGNDDTRDTRSVLLNASYKVMPELKVTVYDYMIGGGTSGSSNYTTSNPDISNIGNDTYGIALTGDIKLAEKAKVSYRAEYAMQTEATMENSGWTKPAGTDVDADYMNLELNANINGFLAGVGYEVLSGTNDADGNTGFKTPFYSAHPFNGWADIFAATPDHGLEDLSIMVGYTSKDFGTLQAVYHDFKAESVNVNYGTEIDIMYTRAIPGVNNLTGMLKYADFDVDSEWVAAAGASKVDVTKFIAMLTYSFATK